MESSLIYFLVLVFYGVSSISCEKLTDEQLRVLFDTPFDMEEFASNIFDLPPSQELYVYEYLLDLIGNLEKDSKMAKFLNASLKLLQEKIDQFNEQHKLQKVPIRKFIQKRIDVQLKVEAKKSAASAAGNKPSPAPETPSSTTTASKPVLKSQPSSTNNRKTSGDSKPGPKDSENSPLMAKKTNSQPKSSKTVATESVGSKHYRFKSEDSESENKKNTLPKSELKPTKPAKELFSTAKENIPIASSSSASKVNDKKSLSRLIQAPLPTNPLNFILTFDDDDDEPPKKKKKHPSQNTKNTSIPKSSSNSKQTQSDVQDSLPAKRLISTSKDDKSQSAGLDRFSMKSQPKPAVPEKKPTSGENKMNSRVSSPATLPIDRKIIPQSTSTKETPKQIQTPKSTNSTPTKNSPKVKPLQKDTSPAKIAENSALLTRSKTMTKPLNEKSSKQKLLQSGKPYVDPETIRQHRSYSNTEATNKSSFSV